MAAGNDHDMGNGRFRLFVLGALVAVLTLALGAVLILTLTGDATRAAPAVATVTMFAGSIIAVLLAILQGARVEKRLDGELTDTRQAAERTEAEVQQLRRTVSPDLHDF